MSDFRFWKKFCSLLCPKRNELYGFGLGIGISILILIVIFSMNPFMAFLNPMFQLGNNFHGIYSIFYSSSSSSLELQNSTKNDLFQRHNEEKMNLSERFKKVSGFELKGESRTLVLDKNSSFFVHKVKEEPGGENNAKNSSFAIGNATSSEFGNDDKRLENDFGKCDIFDGQWVRLDRKPYYPAGSCPIIDRDFDCYRNGRSDDEFLKWQWQTNGCNIPSLINATDFLERMRGKRLVFVGDSLNRNMWESLVCILRHEVTDKSRVFEASGKTSFKKEGVYSFLYKDYNCSIDFVHSPFLVQQTYLNDRNISRKNLRLDLMDNTSSLYHDADVMVFNSWHWWTIAKTSGGENYYQEGSFVYPKLEITEAYKKALTTWGRWIDKNINVNRTQVVFRGYSVTHFSGGKWNTGGKCHRETEPIMNETYVEMHSSKVKVLEDVLRRMRTPVLYLNISKLTYYRADGHPSIYRKECKTVEEKIAAENSQDCNHWCLPGVPDTWNELLYASLLNAGKGSRRTYKMT